MWKTFFIMMNSTHLKSVILISCFDFQLYQYAKHLHYALQLADMNFVCVCAYEEKTHLHRNEIIIIVSISKQSVLWKRNCFVEYENSWYETLKSLSLHGSDVMLLQSLDLSI